MVLRPLADPREEVLQQLSREKIKLEGELSAERQRRRNAESDMEDAQREKAAVMEGVQRLRASLTPLYDSLKLLFGDMEAMGVEESPAAAGVSSIKNSAVWESWKQKLGGLTAKAIDALLVHGEMSANQLRIHLQCRQNTAYDVISKLNKAGVVNKNGGKVSLKSL